MSCSPKIYRNPNPQMGDSVIDLIQTKLSEMTYLDELGNTQFWAKEIFGICEPAQTDSTPYGWDLNEYVSAQPNDKHGLIVFFADRGMEGYEFSERKIKQKFSIVGWVQEKRFDITNRGSVMYAIIHSIIQDVFSYNSNVFSSDLEYVSHQTTMQTNHNVFEGFDTHTFLDAYNSCIAFRIDFNASFELDCNFQYQQVKGKC